MMLDTTMKGRSCFFAAVFAAIVCMAAQTARAVDSLEETRGNVTTTAQLAFKDVALKDVGTMYALRARMQGGWFDDDGVEGTFFNRQETRENGVLVKVTYQLQAIDGGVKAATIEFTEGEGGVYAKRSATTNSGNLNTFGTEPFTANSASGDYVPYDLKLVEPVVRSINVNFSNGNNLNTTSSVRYGAGDYAVPYTDWYNMSAGNGTTTVKGATVKTTNVKNAWSCPDLSSAKDVRHGYLDDGNTTPTVTVTDVPYASYRVVVYVATDNADVKFGYVTINGTDYKGDTDSTVEGNTIWGATGAENKAKGLREGVNYLVSPVLTGSTATIVGHKMSGARGCIAAFQIVEAITNTYTATIDAAGTENFSDLSWDTALPASLYSARLVVNVEEDATLNIDSTVDASAVEFNVASGKTLTLSGNTVTAGAIAVKGAGQVVVGSASQFVGTLRGNGTVVYDGVRPTTTGTDIVLTDPQWTGTLVVKGYNKSNSATGADRALYPQFWGSANSKIKWNGVCGYFGGCTSAAGWILEDLDSTTYPALTKNDGGSSALTTAPSLEGTGTFADASNPTERFKFANADNFTGTISITSAAGKGMNVQFGATAVSVAAGAIHVLSGATATVATGKTWTAQGGIIVNGTLMLGAGATAPAVVSGTGTVGVTSGTGTLNGYGAAALTLATAPNATLAIVDANLATMTIGAFNNMGTIDLTGTALTEATLNLGSGVTAATTGTILYPATFQKFVVSPADQSIRSLDGYTLVEGLPEGATYYVTLAETREEFGKGSMIVTNAAEGVNVRVARPDGTFVDVLSSDGVATLTEMPQIAGAATLYDVTFKNNSTDVGTKNGTFTYKGVSSGNLKYDSNASFNNALWDDSTGVYIKHHPYIDGANGVFNSLEDFTAIVVGQMSPTHRTQFIHLGSSISSNIGILIATTENDNEVLIAMNAGKTVDSDGGVRVSVPNAATARHAYMVVRAGNTFVVWVDGVKRGSFTVPEGFSLGASSHSGLQVGSDFGGAISGDSGNGNYANVADNDSETGVINVIRLFDYSISEAQAEAIFNAYPYVSQGGLYTRTVAADGTFSETGTWEKEGASGTFAVPEGATVEEVYYNPSATLDVDVAAEIEVNADVALETFTVGGSATVTFKADGAHTVTVLGAAIINSPVTVEYGAVYLAGAPVQLGSSGSICFDCSGFDISGIFETTRFQLTGLTDRDDAKMSFVSPAAVLSRTVSFGYNTTGSCYDFVVTPDRTAGTVYYKSGTYAEGSTDLRIVMLDGEGNETETVLFPGDNVVFDDAVAGGNAVVQFGETLPANVTFSFGDWTGAVVPVLPSSMCVWTGEAGDGKANTAGNWYGGIKPYVGAAVYIPSKTAAIDNDIAGFAPASITFGYGTGVVTIGGNAITGVAAVTNLSAATHTFECPVAFADRIFVSQKAKGWDSRAQSSVRFAGGVTGATFADGTARFLNGAYNLSTAEDWVANTYNDDTRWGIPQGSSLTVPLAENTVELAIGQADSFYGGAFTAGVVRTTGRICCWNKGEYVVTNELVFTLPGADKHVSYQSSDGAFKFEKITLGDQGASKWLYFANEGNYNYTKNIWIGAGGLNFASGASADTAYACGRRDKDVIYLRPWHSDYTIGTKSNSTADLVINKETYFGTDDENGVARTVTCDGKIRIGAAVYVEGKGTFRVNGTTTDGYTGTWTVKDTATLAIKPGASLGTGATTVNSGATLEVAESGRVALDGGLTLADSAILGFNFTERKVAPVLDLTDKTVTVNGTIKVKVEGVQPAFLNGGKHVLTSGGKFTGANVLLAEGSETWANGVSVENGDIVVDAKPMGTLFVVK